MIRNICFIGAGNLATHLSGSLQEKGYNIVQVYSRSINSAKLLAGLLSAKYTSELTKITTDADIYFVALKDSAVSDVLSQINFKNKLVVHCSGSLPLSVLNSYSENIGVLYPLQTFSKSRDVDFSEIPVFVEANSEKNKDIILRIAKNISTRTSVLDSERRKSLHVAAVFVCNFVNHMYTLASDYLDSKEIDFDVLKPLIKETADKVQIMKPKNAQTGPAVRFDENIINDHLKQLENFSRHQELYNSISKSIFESHQENI